MGFSQDSLLQPEHRKMAIAPSGELTASMNVMGLLHAAHIGRCLVSRFAIRANAGQSRRFLSFCSSLFLNACDLVFPAACERGVEFA
jgi:hypothetical protein